MKSLAGIVGLALALACAPAGDAAGQSNEGSTRADQINEKDIRLLYDQFAVAWNHHDVPALSNMWALDGDHVEPDGTHADGRDRVAKLLARQHETVFKDTELHLSIDDVWFVKGDVALVDGGYTVSGIRTPDGQEIPPRRGRLTSLLLNEQGRWWIAASRLMIPAALPYKK